MPPPFVIFALPRSRTAWLSQWLHHASGGDPVGHDTAIEANSIDGWLETIYRHVRGTCETGAVEAWPILRQAIPDCRIVTVHRDLADVVRSLEAFGAIPPWRDLERRHAALRDLAEKPGVLSVAFADLVDPRVCATLEEHCLSMPFNWPVWHDMACRNVQLDLPARMARLAERRPVIDALKAELAERLANPRPFVSVGEERWDDVAADVERLGASHYQEATEGAEGPFKLDRATLSRMASAGLYRVIVARIDGVMVGYCCWTHEINCEAVAEPTMDHGPFYVVPGAASFCLGTRLLETARATFGPDGYKVLRLHHTVHGRGARAGKLYERLGAVEYQREYIWRIGEASNA